MPGFDFRIFQHTDPRIKARAVAYDALVEGDGGDRFPGRRMLSGAFANPAIFQSDETVQQAFLNLVGSREALKMTQAFRLYGVTKNRLPSVVEDRDDAKGRWQPLNVVMLKKPAMDFSYIAVHRIIRNIRETVYQRREVGLPPNMLRVGRADFLQGDIDIRNDKSRGGDVQLPNGLLNTRALFAPDIGLRMLGERELAIVANEQLHLLWQEGMRGRWGKSKREPMRNEWSYRYSINELIRVFGDVDATPFVENILDQLIEEGLIGESRRHLVVATYHDYALSYLDRRLQSLIGITPAVESDATLNAMMRSLMLALDSSAMPVELRDDTVLADIFLSSRAQLNDFLGETETLHAVREVIREYMQLYDDKGLTWFLGQTLPLVALFSDADSLHRNGIHVVQAFSPNAHYGWNSYATVMEQVQSIVDPSWDDPDGGERMIMVGADIPVPASSFGFGVSHNPGIVNYAAPCIRGGMLMAG